MKAHTYAHTHTHSAGQVQYEENRPAHLVLHTRDKQLKSAPHAGHQFMCCHIWSGSTVSKGPKDRPYIVIVIVIVIVSWTIKPPKIGT